MPFTGDFPGAWRQGKQGVINFTPTYLASVWGSGPQKVRYGTTRPRLLPLNSPDQYQIGRSISSGEKCLANERRPSATETRLFLSRLSHRLEDQQSLRSLICVFSLSGSLSQSDRSALIKSGFSISIAACSMRSKAPGWQSPLLSATLSSTTTPHTHTH